MQAFFIARLKLSCAMSWWRAFVVRSHKKLAVQMNIRSIIETYR
jgi:hypothetical protein